jgi:transcriptional repressor NrdR
MLMEGLKGIDTVAYIRFASVYKDFAEARDFEEFAGTIGGGADNAEKPVSPSPASARPE